METVVLAEKFAAKGVWQNLVIVPAKLRTTTFRSLSSRIFPNFCCFSLDIFSFGYCCALFAAELPVSMFAAKC